MKIFFDNVNWSSSAGPHHFAHQLATELSYMGHIVADPNDFDVALVFIEPSGAVSFDKKPRVQRLDGIWFKPEEFLSKNVRIKLAYESYDHIIWQSEFDKEMTCKWWGSPKAGTVVRNGTIAKPVTTYREALLDLREKYAKIFVCSAAWHGQKRLNANIRLFSHIRNTIEPNSCLVIMGDNTFPAAGVTKNQPIFFTGKLDPSVCLEIFSIADWMLHLAWCDHSPNTVIQALSQGCPVICTDVGGTKELVGANGIVIKDSPYSFELYDYDNPPYVDVTQITSLPDVTVDASNIGMRAVAERYVEVFKSCIDKIEI
jgi:glycosyltransferase involved in cell wall biosynthesis